MKTPYPISPCTDEEAEYVEDMLIEYNLSKVPAKQNKLFEPINLKIADETGKVIAGCLAVMYCWHVMYVDILWVDEAYRRQGLGSCLLLEAERQAKDMGCYLAHLDTFDFQAKAFYEKHNYTVFGTLTDCPEGHSRYYLQKRL